MGASSIVIHRHRTDVDMPAATLSLPAGAALLLVMATPSLLVRTPCPLPVVSVLVAVMPFEARDAALVLMLAAPDLLRWSPQLPGVLDSIVALIASTALRPMLAAPFLLHSIPGYLPCLEIEVAIVPARPWSDRRRTTNSLVCTTKVLLLLWPRVHVTLMAIVMPRPVLPANGAASLPPRASTTEGALPCDLSMRFMTCLSASCCKGVLRCPLDATLAGAGLAFIVALPIADVRWLRFSCRDWQRPVCWRWSRCNLRVPLDEAA